MGEGAEPLLKEPTLWPLLGESQCSLVRLSSVLAAAQSPT